MLVAWCLCKPTTSSRNTTTASSGWQRQHSDYYDDNTIAYVALHEAAHTLTKSIGHGPEFQRVFAVLLGRAAAAGYYDPRIPVDPRYPRAKKPVQIIA